MVSYYRHVSQISTPTDLKLAHHLVPLHADEVDLGILVETEARMEFDPRRMNAAQSCTAIPAVTVDEEGFLRTIGNGARPERHDVKL